MKILIVLSHNRFTGVNTWAFTLANEFLKNGHSAEIEIRKTDDNFFSFVDDYTWYTELLFQHNIKFHVNELNLDYSKYDAIIVSNLVLAKKYEEINCKKIYVMHGMLTKPELSIPPLSGFYKISVSPFLKDWWNCDETIINGIDLDFFKPSDHLHFADFSHIRIFYCSRYSMPEYLRNIFNDSKYELTILSEERPTEIRKLMYESDIVIGYGRSCYEAMACGKPVFVAGKNGVDGWIRSNTFNAFLYKNCSGYLNKIGVEAIDKIKFQFEQLDIYDGVVNRKLAETHLSSEIMYNKYINAIGRI